MGLSNTYPFLDTLYQSPDLSEKQCRELYVAGGIAAIGLDESGRRIWFLKMTGDKGIVVNESGNAKLYKDAFTADVKLIWIKHGC
jgi:hypothetical protein